MPKMPTFDRNDKESVLTAAKRLATAYGECTYVVCTSFGFTVMRQKPLASVAQYVTVYPERKRRGA